MKAKLSEFVALVAAISLLSAAACGGNDGETSAARGTGISAPAPGSGAPTLSLETPAPAANEPVPGEIEAAARRLLADKLGADEGAFRLDSAEGMGWSDASLGCPKEGYAYAQVITPGYKLVFAHAGTSYPVHTNSDGSHVEICEDG